MKHSQHLPNLTGVLSPSPYLEPGLSDPPLLTVYTLGRFAVYRNDERIEDSSWKRRKAKNLFKLLLLAPDYQLLKDRVLEWLWPDQDPDRAANNLHRTLFILRRVLQPNLSQAAGSQYVLFKDNTLALNPEGIAWVDAKEFERLLRLARQQNHNLSLYEAARELYQGEFLPEDLYEEWAGEYRATLHLTYCNALQQMAQLYSDRKAYGQAIQCLQDLLRTEPTHETAYRELMCLYTLTGQRHQALRLYQQARETLQRELETQPSSGTTALYQAIIDDRWQPESEAVSVQVIGKPATLPDSPNRPPLIAREQEIGHLEAVMRQVKNGRGTVVILSGEQGIGKTRLAEEITSRARAANMQVLPGAAYEQEGHLPYGPFVEAIRHALAGQSQQAVQVKLGPMAKDLARLLPELADTTLSMSMPFNLEMGQERQRLFDAVTTTFLTLAQESPLLVFLDDLHAAGESSLQLLHYLARRITAMPILILCTVREEAARRGTPIARLCRELVGNQLGQRLQLPRLNPAETARLCSHLLGGGALHPALREALYQLTEGNPFFVHALVLALIESGKLEQQNQLWHFPAEERLAIPHSIREAIGLHLEHLSQEADRLIGLAAVVGREFSYELLRATSQWHDAALLDLLDELINAYLIEETESGYRFHHGLIRQVIYEELSLHRRAWLHAQVAQALEQLTARQIDERVAILAYHYEHAEHYDVAVRYLVRAGDRAQSTYAPREALDHYNRALTLHHQHPEVVTRDMMAGLLKQRAQTHLALSDFDAAIGDLEQLLDNNYYPNNDFRKGEILYQLGIAHYWAHRLERAAYYLDQTIKLAVTFHHHELRTRALKLRDILNSTQGNVGQVLSGQVSGSTEREHSLPPEEHWGHAMLAHLRSDFEVAHYHAQACVELGQSLGNTFLMLGGYFVLGMSHASLGYYQIALDHLRYALNLAESTGERFWRARLLNTIGWAYRDLYHLEKAIEFDQASLELARTSRPRLTEAEGNALANLATDHLLLHEYDQARAYLNQGLKAFSNEPFMRWRYRTRMIIINGRLELAEGKVMAALAAADESLIVARSTRARKNIARSCRLRGEALVQAGRPKKARSALRHALYVSLSVKSPALIWPCHLALARFEEAQHRLDVAGMHYLGAAQILTQIANELTDPALAQPFLAAAPVQLVFSKAVCPVRLA